MVKSPHIEKKEQMAPLAMKQLWGTYITEDKISENFRKAASTLRIQIDQAMQAIIYSLDEEVGAQIDQIKNIDQNHPGWATNINETVTQNHPELLKEISLLIGSACMLVIREAEVNALTDSVLRFVNRRGNPPKVLRSDWNFDDFRPQQTGEDKAQPKKSEDEKTTGNVLRELGIIDPSLWFSKSGKDKIRNEKRRNFFSPSPKEKAHIDHIHQLFQAALEDMVESKNPPRKLPKTLVKIRELQAQLEQLQAQLEQANAARKTAEDQLTQLQAQLEQASTAQQKAQDKTPTKPDEAPTTEEIATLKAQINELQVELEEAWETIDRALAEKVRKNQAAQGMGPDGKKIRSTLKKEEKFTIEKPSKNTTNYDLLLNSLPTRFAQEVRSKRVNKKHKKRTTILDQGDINNGPIYAITEGYIIVSSITENGKQTTSEILGPGDLIGLDTLEKDSKNEFYYQTLTPCKLETITKRPILEALTSSPQAMSAFAQIMQKTAKRLHKQISLTRAPNVPSRLSGMLEYLLENFGAKGGNAGLIPIRMTRQDLADMSGTTVETTIRLMKKWEREGIISTLKNGFNIHNLQALINQGNIE